MFGRKNKEIIIDYTVEICQKCQMQRKRRFVDGDVLFAESSKCTSCDGTTRIEKIFGETMG